MSKQDAVRMFESCVKDTRKITDKLLGPTYPYTLETSAQVQTLNNQLVIMLALKELLSD